MARVSLGVRTTGVAVNTPALEIRAGAASKLRVVEVNVSIAAATASTFALGRPAAIGATPTAPVTLLPHDPLVSGIAAQVALAWGTAPTSPAAFLRRAGLPAAIGNGFVWLFSEDDPLIIPAGGSVVLWNVTANSAADVTIMALE